MLAAWVLFPLVLAALCAGLGLLVDLLCGRRLPGALVLPAGLAAIVVVGGFTTLADATAELTAPLLAALAVLGAGLSLPWRFGRPDPWALAAALGVFLVFGAPVILSGEPTFAGFIKLDDTATWLALTDQTMAHGHDLSSVAPSTYRATLDFNLAEGYPVGAFIPWGAAQKLAGGDLAWVFQPYLSFLAAMLSLCLFSLLGGTLRPRPLRALVAFVAAQPALLVGYALWGGVKEVAVAFLIALAAALAPAVLRASDFHHTGVGSMSDALADDTAPPGRGDAVRDVAPLVLAAGALVGVASGGGLIWLGPMLAALAYLAWRRFGLGAAIRRAATFVAGVAVLAIPVISTGGLLPPTSTPLTNQDDAANLGDALDPLQLLGLWPAGDFRVAPDASVATAVLIALALLAAAVGLWALWRRRRDSAPLLYATALVSCLAIVAVGSPWVDGKALATAAPVALSLVMIGAAAFLRADRPTGVALLAVLAGGVLWSNALAYGGVSLAPYGQLAELEEIGERFAGEGPALMTEYEPYGARHFLRRLDAEGASELRVRQVTLLGGGTAEKGEAVDVDEILPEALFEYRTLVLRRSPVRSRPPSPYRLVWAGEDYEVWQRPILPTGLPPEHLALGGPLDPAAVPGCSEVAGLGLLALQHGATGVRMLAARHAPVLDATSGALQVPRAGVYEAWLEGSVPVEVELLVDGRRFGEARNVLNNQGGFIALGDGRLGAGTHRAELRFGGPDLHPGSGESPETGPLLFAPAPDGAAAEAGEIVSVPIDDSQLLCGKRWDWIEAVGTG
jgi:hypothetical protein